MEVETTRLNNPVVQDTKKKDGVKVPRHYLLTPMFNYGCVPQTWEDPTDLEKSTGAGGDNDPLDIVDLTPRDMSLLELPSLKIIGALCMIDQGELDWKLLALEESYAR